MDIYAYKQRRLIENVECTSENKGTVGLALQLGMYEQLPFWSTFFKALGFNVVLSKKSSHDFYYRGQHTTDTACYPSKLIHGHIESLLDKGVDFIFMPCESYNINQHCSTNNYNCPVVAYYPELLKAKNYRLNEKNFIMPYIDLNDEKNAANKLYGLFKNYGVKKKAVEKAINLGFTAIEKYHSDVRLKAEEILFTAREQGKQTVILAGRPYYLDNEINHGINKLLTSLGVAVLSEDAVYDKGNLLKANVLSQWTYHARLYCAADFAINYNDVNLVQLVSCGCELDAITSNAISSIMEKNKKPYTQIKIDEIYNLDAVKIRLRSMLAAIEEVNKNKRL